VLTIAILVTSAVLALYYPNLARWSAILSFLFVNEQLRFEWLPGTVFSWNPQHPSLAFTFALLVMTSLVYARDLKKSVIAMLILFSAGLVGFLGATNPFELFFFLELMLFPAFYIILQEDPSAAFKYFGFMQVSSVLVLAGLLGEGKVASILLTLGFAIKMGLFPFHSWLPDAHSQAPFQLSALLSGAVVACGAYGVFRYSSTPELLLPLGIISAIYGAVGANAEHDIKRLLAYSTVSQMGYAAIALLTSREFLVLFLIMHALAKASLFFTAGELIRNTGMRIIRDIRVDSKTLFLTTLISSLSLAGFPPLLGFTTELGILKSTWAYSKVAGLFFAFAIFPTILYCERLLSVFFKKSGRKLETALPLIIALLLLPGVIPWTSS